MNKDKLSILSAEKGKIVEDMQEKGIYLDDNYNIINLGKKNNLKKIKDIKAELAREAEITIDNLNVFLCGIKHNLKTKGAKKQYILTEEEVKYLKLILTKRYKEKGILKVMKPKEAWEFLQQHTRLMDIKGYKKLYNLKRQKVKKEFNGFIKANRIYFEN
ncbi:MAG: hypothetical protein ACQESP_12500, partial [Candidatus Muiribacteriota bacterium]